MMINFISCTMFAGQ